MGFTRYSRDFFKTGIGEIDHVLKNDHQLRFSVAKVKGTKYFIGGRRILFAMACGRYTISTVRGFGSLGYRCRVGLTCVGLFIIMGTLHYPILYNQDFTTTDEIDLDNFYVVGVDGNNIGKPAVEYRKNQFKYTVG